MADMNGNNRKVADDGDNNNNNKNHLPDKEVEEKENDVNDDKDVVKDDSDEEVVTDRNNNAANGGDQVPGGAVALPDHDVVMVETGLALANTITRAIQDHSTDATAWVRLHLPDGVVGLGLLNLSTTVGTINERLAQAFGARTYFLGFRLVTGLIFSAPLRYTVEELGELKTDLGIGSFMEDWYEEE